MTSTSSVVVPMDGRNEVKDARRPAWRWVGRTAADFVFYASAVVLTTLLMWPVLRLDRASLSVPFIYSGDGNSGAAQIKAVLDHGWYESNPSLAAPAGQVFHDFPMPDNLHLMVTRVAGLFTDQYAVVLNLYFLLGFPLAALTASWSLREVRVSRVVALPLAVLFAFAPYHFLRGEVHLTLGAYWPVPLAAVLVLRVIGGASLWARREGHGRWALKAWLTLANAGTLVILLLLGTASSYYALFTLFLLAFAGLVAVLREHRLTDLVGSAAAGVLLLGVMMANLAPDLLYARSHGANMQVLKRSSFETELYAFKFASLILPSSNHRVGRLADIRMRYDRDFPLPSESPALGLIAALGLVFLLCFALYAVAAGRGRVDVAGSAAGSTTWTRLSHLAALSLFSLLLATVGGFSTVFALLVTSNVHGWNRISIFLSLFSLAAVGLLLDALAPPAVRRWRTRSTGRPRLRFLAFAAGVPLVFVVGMLDQTSPTLVPDYAGTAVAFHSDERLVRAMQQELPRGAMVFQLPYTPFPESPAIYALQDYDELRPYLHSTTLRWSYGGLKGRPRADWSALAAGRPVAKMLPEVSAAGFAAVLVDRTGYADAGRSLEADLRQSLGSPESTSPDGRYSSWSLAAVHRRLAARHTAAELARLGDAVVNPVMAYFKPDFPSIAPNGTHSDATSVTLQAASLMLENDGTAPRTVTLSFGLATTGFADIHITFPDGTRQHLATSANPTPVTATLLVPPGRHRVRLAGTATQPSPLPQQIVLRDTEVTDPQRLAFRP
jgi:hypothetical protein